jgi:hypothetical protein
VTGVADRHLRAARPLGRVDLEAAEQAAQALLAGPARPGPRRPRTRAEFLALATTVR